MAKKYFILLNLIAVSALTLSAEGQDVPRAKDLKRRLNDLCHKKLCIVKEADKQNYFTKITESYRRIRLLEEKHGIASIEEKQRHALNVICQNPDRSPMCPFVKTFQEYDSQRFDKCTDMKCYIMKLYHHLNTLTHKLAESLKPHRDELLQINEDIYKVKKELKDLGHQEDEFFTLYPNMILL